LPAPFNYLRGYGYMEPIINNIYNRLHGKKSRQLGRYIL
jgi:hypothetical protein